MYTLGIVISAFDIEEMDQIYVIWNLQPTYIVATYINLYSNKYIVLFLKRKFTATLP